MSQKGLLIANLGSPDSTSVSDVRRYLAQFLMDKYVIDVPWLLRLIIVYLFILPFRPKRSAEAYASIWWEEGSPLVVISQRFTKKLQAKLEIPVALGMCYGQPSLKSAIEELVDQGVDQITLAPMYPHYAMSTITTGVEAVKNEVKNMSKKRGTPLTCEVIAPFYNDPDYIKVLSKSLEEGGIKKAEHIVFSYHGLPTRHLKKTDPTGKWCQKQENCCHTPCDLKPNPHEVCYSHQVYETTRLVVETLGLKETDYTVCFQSRLGRDEWLTPSFDDTIIDLAKRGVKDVAVACPAFVADCLETLEEIGEEGQETFKEHGGETYNLIACLNDRDDFVDAMQRIIDKKEKG